jgi:hypothetical protein
MTHLEVITLPPGTKFFSTVVGHYDRLYMNEGQVYTLVESISVTDCFPSYAKYYDRFNCFFIDPETQKRYNLPSDIIWVKKGGLHG